MKFYFIDTLGRKHELTLKKGSAEWVNYDCPDIFTEDHRQVFHMGGMNGWYNFIDDDNILKQFRKFIIASDKAFCRKYPHIATFQGKEGNLVNNLDKEISLT